MSQQEELASQIYSQEAVLVSGIQDVRCAATYISRWGFQHRQNLLNMCPICPFDLTVYHGTELVFGLTSNLVDFEVT